jgi:aminopeptidase YwaD
VIICGHYDTITVRVSDNGSGTSIILEAARILKDVPTEYSIKFIHFSGEEQGW